jgi:hypothetical protein
MEVERQEQLFFNSKLNYTCKVSISLTVNTLLSLGVAWICLVSLDARPANTEGDLDELKRAYYIDNYLQNSDGLTKDSEAYPGYS